jgi:hypothetical protein
MFSSSAYSSVGHNQHYSQRQTCILYLVFTLLRLSWVGGDRGGKSGISILDAPGETVGIIRFHVSGMVIKQQLDDRSLTRALTLKLLHVEARRC